jgi:hypothetical protein
MAKDGDHGGRIRAVIRVPNGPGERTKPTAAERGPKRAETVYVLVSRLRGAGHDHANCDEQVNGTSRKLKFPDTFEDGYR